MELTCKTFFPILVLSTPYPTSTIIPEAYAPKTYFPGIIPEIIIPSSGLIAAQIVLTNTSPFLGTGF